MRRGTGGGAAIDSVKERLGEPVSEIRDDEGYDDLHYGGAADFLDHSLQGRKDGDSVQDTALRSPDGEGSGLNAAIRSLHRGMSTGAVEVKLGEPRDPTLEVGGTKSRPFVRIVGSRPHRRSSGYENLLLSVDRPSGVPFVEIVDISNTGTRRGRTCDDSSVIRHEL
jgi:hypothetical protein